MSLSLASDFARQLVVFQIPWSIGLLLLLVAMRVLGVRNPRTRYRLSWAAYCMILPAAVIALVAAPQLISFRGSATSVALPTFVSSADAASATRAPIDASWIVFTCVALGAAWFAWRWASLAWTGRRWAPCRDDRVLRTVEELRDTLGIRHDVECRVSPRAAIPSSVGIWRPTIVLSPSLSREVGPRDLRHVLAHELAHIRRRDYLANLVQKLVRALFFFNPLALWFDARLDECREVACDRDVLEHARVDRRAYATTLLHLGVRLGPQGAGSPSVTLFRHDSQLKRRVLQMKAVDTSDRALKVVLLSLIVLTAFAFISCSNTKDVTGPDKDKDAAANASFGKSELVLHEAGEAGGDAMFFSDQSGVSVEDLRHLFEQDPQEGKQKLHELLTSQGQLWISDSESEPIVELMHDGRLHDLLSLPRSEHSDDVSLKERQAAHEAKLRLHNQLKLDPTFEVHPEDVNDMRFEWTTKVEDGSEENPGGDGAGEQ